MKVSAKTVDRATALVQYEEAQVEVRQAKAKMSTAKDAVARAKAYREWVLARQKRQEAGKVLRPRRKRSA